MYFKSKNKYENETQRKKEREGGRSSELTEIRRQNKKRNKSFVRLFPSLNGKQNKNAG